MCLAVPGQIVRITNSVPLARTAAVRFGGITREINISLVPEAGVGDYILAHVGIAIGRIDEEEAHKVFEYLDQIGEVDISPPEENAGVHE